MAALKPPAVGQEEHADDLVTGLRLRIGAGGRKAWIVRTRAGGKPINKTIGTYPVLSLSKARDEAKKLLIEIATIGAPRTQRTFGELADQWLKNVAEPNNRSWRLQKRRLEIHVLPRWKALPLDRIKRSDVRELVDSIEGTVAPGRALAIVRTLFRYAMSRDWIDASPAEAIGNPGNDTPRDRVLNMDEVRRTYAAAGLLGYPFGGFVTLLFLTGQRRTEVAAMRWDQVDLEAGTWILPADATKSERAHMVPLSPAAVDVLKLAPCLGEYVWTSNGRTPISGFSKTKIRLDEFVAARGDPIAPWRFHDIRRSVATHMVRLGVTETVVGRILNHAPQGVTARVYALHSYAPEKREALQLWATEINGGLS
ncbi:integrase [Sphingomonas sp. PvP055]